MNAYVVVLWDTDWNEVDRVVTHEDGTVMFFANEKGHNGAYEKALEMQEKEPYGQYSGKEWQHRRISFDLVDYWY